MDGLFSIPDFLFSKFNNPAPSPESDYAAQFVFIWKSGKRNAGSPVPGEPVR
jgi:hypothetical protein